MIWVRTLALAIFILIITFAEPLQADPAKTGRVIILYEASTRLGANYPLADALAECLGHFNLSVKEMPRGQWRPGMLSDYGIVFYIGSERADLPAGLLEEMKKAPRLVWIEQNIDQYARAMNWGNFLSESMRRGFVTLRYRSRSLPFPAETPICVAYPESGATVLAYADNLDRPVPFSWRKGNTWYIGRLSFQGSAFWIMADLLHDICGEDHAESHRVLLRIEDVNPSTPPAKLEALINAIADQHVPFAVGVIPAYLDKGKIITLNDVPKLVEVLKKAEDYGGCIIQHGYTHENQFSPRTGEGYEFWDGRDDTPMPGDQVEFVNQRVNSGLAVFAREKIYPVAFEAPHYAMSQEDYRVLSKHYSILLGAVQLSDRSSAISFSAPYAFKSLKAGMEVFPDTLGYFDPDVADGIGNILEQARQLTVVRDCQVGLFYHNYLPPENLSVLIEGLKKLGYEFTDLRALSYRVEGQGIKIVSQDGRRDIYNVIAPSESRKMSRTEIFFRDWANSLFWLLIIVVLSFSFIIATLRRNKKRLYEGGGGV